MRNKQIKKIHFSLTEVKMGPLNGVINKLISTKRFYK